MLENVCNICNMETIYHCIEIVQARYKDNENKIEYLEKENRRLKDENYKDKQLSDMQQRLDKMQNDYWRGFPISEQEEKSIEDWKRKHDKEVHRYTSEMRMKAEGCCGGRYKYIFVPTSLGVSGKIVCHCGSEFEFQEIG